MDKLQDLLEKIKVLEGELSFEIQKKEEEFSYKIHGRKVYFEEAVREQHKELVKKIHAYILEASLQNIITAPIISFCLVPAVFMDLVVTVFHSICFRVYGIPRVRRNDYIVIDRHALSYLNPLEKMICVYCGYFNGLIEYIQEIAARTEQYWCPIKHAGKIRNIHSRYKKFLEYGDGNGYKIKFEQVRKDFDDLQ
jgi:hypothetical protein